MNIDQMRELVKECGLDWHRGFMPLFDGDETDRYAVLIEEAIESSGLQAEIARLTAENAALSNVAQAYDDAMHASNLAGYSGMSAAETITDLAAENAELRKAADRYRHFIDQMCDETFDTLTTGYRMQQIAHNIQAATKGTS